MKPHLSVVTLAVNDLEKSLVFYRDGLGLPTKGIVATQFKGTETEPAGAVAFFELCEELVDFLVAGDITLEGFSSGKLLDKAFCAGAHAFVLIADGERSAGGMQLLGDAPGDAALVG